MLLMAAISLLTGCASKRVSSPTHTQPSANVAVANSEKSEKTAKKSLTTDGKAAKKAEKPSGKSVKASEPIAKAGTKAVKPKATANKTEKPRAKADVKAKMPTEKKAAKSDEKVEKASEKKSLVAPAAVQPPRQLADIPLDDYPPAPLCRLWLADRAPREQPEATECHKLGKVPAGAFVLFNYKYWDADYDWRAQEKREWGSVPGPVLVAMRGARR
jgi:hypothetical protein